MSKKIEIRNFEDIVNELKETVESINNFKINEKIRNDECSEIIDKLLNEIRIEVSNFKNKNENRLLEHPKIKAITSNKTSQILVDIYRVVLEQLKSESNIDYDLFKTHMLDKEDILYLMVDEPLIYHMSNNCEFIEDEDGREYKILNIDDLPSIPTMAEFIYGGSYYPAVNVNFENTVYLGDVATYRKDSKFKGAIVGDPTKIKL